MKKRFLAFIIVTAMALCLMPTTIFATAGTKAVTVYVGDTLITSSSTVGGGTAIYDSSTGILTINNVVVSANESHNNAAIYADGDLTIELVGTNTFTGPIGKVSRSVFVDGNLTIQGSGTLSATAGTVSSSNISVTADSFGVYAMGNLTVNGGTLYGIGGAAKGNGTNANNCGVYANGIIKVSDGTLNGTGDTADANSASAYSFGVYGANGIQVSGNGELTGKGGDTTTQGGGHTSYGVFASGTGITVTGGKLTGIGGSSGNSRGVYTASANITVTGGTLTGEGGVSATSADNDTSFGVFSDGDSSSSIEVSGTGVLKGTGGTVKGTTFSQSGGVYSGTSITVSGGSLTAIGGKSTKESYGLMSASINLSGGITIAKTINDADASQTTRALNNKVNSFGNPSTWYKWRTLSSDKYTQSTTTAYVWEKDSPKKYLEIRPNVPTCIIPSQISQNGVTASVAYSTESPQIGDIVIVTVKLTGTSKVAGTHTINLNSITASLTGIAQNITVTAKQDSFTAPTTYSFLMPAADVDDMTLTHTFTPMAAGESTPQTGDTTSYVIWIGVMLFAAVGIVANIIVIKKKQA